MTALISIKTLAHELNTCPKQLRERARKRNLGQVVTLRGAGRVRVLTEAEADILRALPADLRGRPLEPTAQPASVARRGKRKSARNGADK